MPVDDLTHSAGPEILKAAARRSLPSVGKAVEAFLAKQRPADRLAAKGKAGALRESQAAVHERTLARELASFDRSLRRSRSRRDAERVYLAAMELTASCGKAMRGGQPGAGGAIVGSLCAAAAAVALSAQALGMDPVHALDLWDALLADARGMPSPSSATEPLPPPETS